MLDPAIALAWQTPFPPTRPDIEIVRDWVSPHAEAAKRLAERLAGSYEAEFLAWSTRIRLLKRETLAVTADRPMTNQDLAEVSRLIEDVEHQAESRAIEAARFRKKAGKAVKQWFERDPAVGAVAQELTARLTKVDTDAVREMLDHAVFLRAFRAERSPHTKISPRSLEELRREVERRRAA